MDLPLGGPVVNPGTLGLAAMMVGEVRQTFQGACRADVLGNTHSE